MELIIWLGLLFSGGYYYSITSVGSSLVLPILAILTVILLFVSRESGFRLGTRLKALNKNRFVLFVLLSITIIIPGLANGNIGTLEIKYILILACSFLIAGRYSFSRFKFMFVRVMFIVAILAILGYFVLMSPLINIFPYITNYNGVEYVNGIFFSAIKYTYSGITNRVQGIFWEPGLFATYMAIAVFFVEKDMFERTRNYWIILITLIVSLILSRSGAGIIMIALLIMIKIFDHKTGVKTVYSVLSFIIYGLLIFAFFSTSDSFNSWINQYLISKVSDSSNVSNLTRMNSIYLDLFLFANKFPFGTGLSLYSYEVSLFKNLFPSSCTSTLTTFLASLGLFGIPLFTFWIKGILRLTKGNGFIAKIGIILLLLVMITKEPHGNLLIMNCLIAYFNFSSDDSLNLCSNYLG